MLLSYSKPRSGQGEIMRAIRGDADIAEGLKALADIDPRLAAITERAGPVPLRLTEPGYEGLANIIVSQMVSKASAAAIWRRLVELAGGSLNAGTVLALDEIALRTVGLSGAKASTLRLAAEAVASGQLDLEHICRLDATEAARQLTTVRGIGAWTADIYLMFCAGHPDIFPVGDIALQHAIRHAFKLNERPSQKNLKEMAETWSPWRSVAARLFWAYYSYEMKRNTDPLG
jgi:DNA-3-methyladenine glycosylase II